jgi:S-formylglutathione hydrolase FrmB
VPGLPVVAVLHGRGNDARGMVTLGLPQFLASAVREHGVPPFVLAAVDGGDSSYWHLQPDGDDPQGMLAHELPGWLRQSGLGHADSGAPRGVLGISMGGAGAVSYAVGRAGFSADSGSSSAPVDVVTALSPAVFRNWPDARTTGGYATEAAWQAYEPLLRVAGPPHRRPAAHFGVWCGAEDPFCPAARTLATDGGARPASFPHGVHTDGFWRRVLPDALAFTAHALRDK